MAIRSRKTIAHKQRVHLDFPVSSVSEQEVKEVKASVVEKILHQTDFFNDCLPKPNVSIVNGQAERVQFVYSKFQTNKDRESLDFCVVDNFLHQKAV